MLKLSAAPLVIQTSIVAAAAATVPANVAPLSSRDSGLREGSLAVAHDRDVDRRRPIPLSVPAPFSPIVTRALVLVKYQVT